jgi:peptide chain release factor 1
MKISIRQKLERAEQRVEELRHLLADPQMSENPQKFRELSVEYARLQPTADAFGDYQRLEMELSAAEEMLADADSDIRALGAEEITLLRGALDERSLALQQLLLPRDERDQLNIFLEVRAGTGGDEAAIFAGDLLRMYSRFAESQGWQIETLSESAGEHGGYREVICRIVGRGVFSRLKFESGTHRVQRIPATEAQGRIHTSTVTVAILPELDEIEKVLINPADLRIDTYRSSGSGGQHVNKTDSAVRITHLPSGIVVECQDERSQHKNRSRAMALLGARLLAAEQEKQLSAQARSRKLQVGSAERSERIRTYNFKEGRVTDHRINLTLYRLPEIMQGDLGEMLAALQQEYQAELLAAAE